MFQAPYLHLAMQLFMFDRWTALMRGKEGLSHLCGNDHLFVIEM